MLDMQTIYLVLGIEFMHGRFSCRISYMCMPRKDHNVNQNVDFCQRRHSKIFERFTVWFFLPEKIEMPDVSFRMCAYLAG